MYVDEGYLIHFRMVEATVFLDTFNTKGIFGYPSPDLCLNLILSLCLPFQIMFNQLNLPQMDSNQVVKTCER